MESRLKAIPIVDLATGRVAGGFCSTREVVSEEELAALAELRRLHHQGQALKAQLATAHATDRDILTAQLTALRQEAALWRHRKEEATRKKNEALGHVTLTLDG